MADGPDRRGGEERRTGKPGPIPGGVERRRSDTDRRRADDDRRRPREPREPRRDDLAGSGRTALTAEAALRARDLDRPTPADLERAEAELAIVRRNWTPPPR